MNFLKISGLVVGTVGVAGVSGEGIYYSDNRSKQKPLVNFENEITHEKSAPENHLTNEDLNETPLDFETDSDDDQDTLSDGNNKNVNTGRRNTHEEIIKSKIDQNFVGKIIFYQKTGKDKNVTYEARLMNDNQYKTHEDELNKVKPHENKKVIDISGNLNSQTTRAKLKEIARKSSSLSNIKKNILSEETELKNLLGETIYASLKDALK